MTEQDILDRGIELIAVSFVDGAGITRAKSITAARAEATARRGVGASKSLGIFTGDDLLSTTTGYEATGDARLVPDLDRLAGGVDGWGWAPGDLLDQEGEPWALLHALVPEAPGGACRRCRVRAADDLRARVVRRDARRPAGALHARLQPQLGRGDRRLHARGGGAAGRLRPHRRTDPPRVLARPDGGVGGDRRPAGRRRQLRRHPPRHPQRLAGHRHPRLVRPDRACGRPRQRLPPALQPVARRPTTCSASIPTTPQASPPRAAPSWPACCASAGRWPGSAGACPISYRRLAPSRWTGAYVCWGSENREAPLRFIRGARAARPDGANAELKMLDCSANPYLMAGAVIAAGLAGLDDGIDLPDPVQIEPSRVADELGLERLPEHPRGRRRRAGRLAAAARGARRASCTTARWGSAGPRRPRPPSATTSSCSRSTAGATDARSGRGRRRPDRALPRRAGRAAAAGRPADLGRARAPRRGRRRLAARRRRRCWPTPPRHGVERTFVFPFRQEGLAAYRERNDAVIAAAAAASVGG